VAQAEVVHRPVATTAKTVVRAVVAVKEIRLLELERQTKVLPVEQPMLLEAVAAAAQVRLAQTEQEATPARVEMALPQASRDRRSPMVEVEAEARMAFTTTTTLRAGRVAVEQVAMAACQPQEQRTQVEAVAAIQASTVQIDPAQMAVRASSSSKCHRLSMLCFHPV
jgi:hypothetical protein